MAKKKYDVATATLEEIKQFAEEKKECLICDECMCDGNKWGLSSCNAVEKELMLRLVKELKDKTPVENQPSSDAKPLEYQFTINYMKKRGYRRCYMCGSDLGGKHDR